MKRILALLLAAVLLLSACASAYDIPTEEDMPGAFLVVMDKLMENYAAKQFGYILVDTSQMGYLTAEEKARIIKAFGKYSSSVKNEDLNRLKEDGYATAAMDGLDGGVLVTLKGGITVYSPNADPKVKAEPRLVSVFIYVNGLQGAGLDCYVAWEDGKWVITETVGMPVS